MIADEVDRNEGVDLLGVSAQHLHGIAHGCEIDHRRNAGEVLHQDARRTERNLAFRSLGLEPQSDRLEVFLADRAAVLVAQQVFEQDLHRERQARNPLEPVFLGDREAVIRIGPASHFQGHAAPKAVDRSHRCLVPIHRDRGDLRVTKYRKRFLVVGHEHRALLKAARDDGLIGSFFAPFQKIDARQHHGFEIMESPMSRADNVNGAWWPAMRLTARELACMRGDDKSSADCASPSPPAKR